MANETVQDNVVVSLAYTLRLQDGQVIDFSEAGDPLEYLHGAHNIIPGLETAVTGMRIGDTKEVEIAPKDGYGDYDAEDMQRIERQQLGDLKLELGTMVTVIDEDGEEADAVVREIGPGHVTLDFNHPLAGQTLFFNVEVVNIREATTEELEHGHVHGAHGHDDEDDEDDEEGEFYFADEEDLDDEDLEEDMDDEDEGPRGVTGDKRYN